MFGSISQKDDGDEDLEDFMKVVDSKQTQKRIKIEIEMKESNTNDGSRSPKDGKKDGDGGMITVDDDNVGVVEDLNSAKPRLKMKPVWKPIENFDYASSKAAILDIGTYESRLGFAGEKAPEKTIRTILGQSTVYKKGHPNHVYIGDGVVKLTGVKKLEIVEKKKLNLRNMGLMEEYWRLCLVNELKVTPRETPVFLTKGNSPSNSEEDEKVLEILLEKVGVPGVYIGNENVLAMIGTGKTDGIVVNCGYSFCSVTPVISSARIVDACAELGVGGRDITKLFRTAVNKNSWDARKKVNLELARKIKEKMCYISYNYEYLMGKYKSSNNLEYKLPDGKSMLTVGAERFKSPEILFQPAMVLGSNHKDGLGKLVSQSLQKIEDKEIVKKLSSNVVLAGGSSMYEGMVERLEGELEQNKTVCKIYETEKRTSKCLGWMGASAMSSLSSFSKHWITGKEYMEKGSGIVHSKCSLATVRK